MRKTAWAWPPFCTGHLQLAPLWSHSLSVAKGLPRRGLRPQELRVHSGTLSGAPAVSSTSSLWSTGLCGLLRLLLPGSLRKVESVVQPGPGFQEAQLPGNMVAAFRFLESLKQWESLPWAHGSPLAVVWLFPDTSEHLLTRSLGSGLLSLLLWCPEALAWQWAWEQPTSPCAVPRMAAPWTRC